MFAVLLLTLPLGAAGRTAPLSARNLDHLQRPRSHRSFQTHYHLGGRLNGLSNHVSARKEAEDEGLDRPLAIMGSASRRVSKAELKLRRDFRGMQASSHLSDTHKRGDTSTKASITVGLPKREAGYWAWRLAILVMTAFWGSNFAVIRYFAAASDISGAAGSQISSSVFATVRFGMAALTLAPFLFTGTRRSLKSGFQIGLFVALGYIGQAIGLETTTAEKAAFICSLQVVFVVAFSSLIGKKSVEKKGVIAALLGIFGVGLLELMGAAAPSIGDIWCLMMPASFGLSYVLVEKYAKDFKGFAVGSFLWLLGEQWQQGKLRSMLLPLLTWSPDIRPALEGLGLAGAPTSFYLGCAYTGVITTAIAIVAQTYAFKKVPSTDASVIIVSEPLWAALSAALILGEQLGVKDLLGGSLIASACLVNSMQNADVERVLKRCK